MLDYLLGFLIYGFIAFFVSCVLLFAYEQARSWRITPYTEEEKKDINGAMIKVSIGAGIVAGIVSVLIRNQS